MIAQSGTRRATETESLRLFLELKQKFDVQAKELQEASTSNLDMKSKGSLLESQITKISEALQAEKKAIGLHNDEIQELENENQELIAQASKDVAVLQALQSGGFSCSLL